ncbi:MAG: hypothetical protein Q8P38_12040 [Candidatus Nanopelagicales bacterium]|nr:hypothetical protein [Candidatus Nanopelagicales bacterium]
MAESATRSSRGSSQVEFDALTQCAAPKLRALMGVGPDVAAQLLITAGGNPKRLTTEGLSTSEIGRCLKRYIAREVHLILKQALEAQPQQIAA